MFMIDILFLYGLMTAVIVRLLWLDTVSYGYEGFWVHKNKYVQLIDSETLEAHRQRRAWTDYIRQLFFRVYDTDMDSCWVIKENRQGIVRCTFCLSFWVSLPIAIAFILFYGISVIYFPLAYFSIVGISAFFSDRM